MQENTNKSIFINSIILYARLFITAVAGLFTTRFTLQALGANDFGLFSVVGSVISFIAIINTIMLSTSNRFIAIAIGKDNVTEINRVFNVNLIVHILIAIVTLITAYPLGDWYILNHINYDGSINSVLTIYHIIIIGSVVSFIGVPYNGLLVAKERFFVFCLTEILASLVKVFVSYILIDYFTDKLLVYSLTICLTTAFPTLVFIVYCKKQFSKIVTFNFIKQWKLYKEMLGFSVWVGYGAIATIGKTQGAALIVNNFFNTAMNTALGIANSVNSILLMFANSINRSISPQIVKSYATGNTERSEQLVIIASKYSFLALLFVVSPFLVAPEWLFALWLGIVPDFVITFTRVFLKSSSSKSPFIVSGSMLSRKNILGKLFRCSGVKRFQYGFNNASVTASPPSAEPPIPRTSTLSNLPLTIDAYSLTYHKVSSLYPKFIHCSH